MLPISLQIGTQLKIFHSRVVSGTLIMPNRGPTPSSGIKKDFRNRGLPSMEWIL